VSEEGLDIEEIFEQISEEETLAEELDLDLTLPAAKKPMGAPADQSEEDDKVSGGGAGKQDDAKSSKKKNLVVRGAA
jgi:hypothetical protein